MSINYQENGSFREETASSNQRGGRGKSRKKMPEGRCNEKPSREALSVGKDAG